MAPSIPATYELASIRTTDSAFNYQLTQEDVLWAARAACKESDEAETPLVLWTFTQRAAWYMPRREGMSFVKVLRSFSQPVNPIWMRDGAMCAPGGDYHGTSFCTEEKLAAREWYSSATWDALEARHPGTMAVVQAWARGLVANYVPRVTNFAVPSVTRKYLTKNPDSRVFYEGANWYVVDPGPSKWPENYVTMVAPNGAVAGYFPTGGQKASAILAALFNGATQWWRGV